jgi:hypothetical protein
MLIVLQLQWPVLLVAPKFKVSKHQVLLVVAAGTTEDNVVHISDREEEALAAPGKRKKFYPKV